MTQTALTTQAIEAVQRAKDLTERDQALAELLELMADGGSLWAMAGDISARLSRFKAAAYPRIQAGYRKPRNQLETALVAILKAGGPCSRRRLHQLLEELVPRTDT